MRNSLCLLLSFLFSILLLALECLYIGGITGIATWVVLCLNVCDWVPKLEDVIKCLGLVLDENFSSLVLHPQFHEELRSIEGVVSCLTVEAKFCHLMTDVVDKIKIEVKGENN